MNTSHPLYTEEVLADAGLFMVTQLASRLDYAIERQSMDQMRQTYLATSKRIVRDLKKMSSLALARKFERVVGYSGCFNPWDVTSEERAEMVLWLSVAMVKVIFGSYIPETSAQTMRNEMVSIFNVVEKNKTGRFTDGEIAAIRSERLGLNTSYRKIGDIYGVSGDMIRSICIGECYGDVAAHLIEVR